MTDETKKYLTEEVLEECWHYRRGYFPHVSHEKERLTNRTFDNEADMMDLYRNRRLHGEWIQFGKFSMMKFREYAGIENGKSLFYQEYRWSDWLFNLPGDPKDYEDRCQMVAEWHKGKGK